MQNIQRIIVSAQVTSLTIINNLDGSHEDCQPLFMSVLHFFIVPPQGNTSGDLLNFIAQTLWFHLFVETMTKISYSLHKKNKFDVYLLKNIYHHSNKWIWEGFPMMPESAFTTKTDLCVGRFRQTVIAGWKIFLCRQILLKQELILSGREQLHRKW